MYQCHGMPVFNRHCAEVVGATYKTGSEPEMLYPVLTCMGMHEPSGFDYRELSSEYHRHPLAMCFDLPAP